MRIALCNYDNGSRWPVLPQNLYHLQKILSSHGHECDVIDFNLNKIPYGRYDFGSYEVIGLGFISGYWQHQEAIKFAAAINSLASRERIYFIIGGHGPSADPVYYKNQLNADAVFVGSADISLPIWLHKRQRVHDDVSLGSGIFPSLGYDMNVDQNYTGHEIDIYKRIRFPTTKDHEFAIQLLSGRGCPYKCAFCYRMDEAYVQYGSDRLFQEVLFWNRKHGITHFQFSDELLMSSRKYIDVLCSRLKNLQSQLGQDLFFDCNGRLNVASKYPEVLRRMKDAGFRYINYGCESMSQEVLDAMNKKQSAEEIRTGVFNTFEAGLTPGLNFLWGNPGDDKESLIKAKYFIKANNNGDELRTIRPVTPYPGTALYKRLIDEGRCSGIDDFYKNHVNSDLFSYHFMEGISNDEANEMLCDANLELVRDHQDEKKEKMSLQMQLFYGGEVDPKSFRGFREV